MNVEVGSHHGMNTSAVACLNEKLHVSFHERHSHRYSAPVWQNKLAVVTELLDNAEDVIPSAAVEAGAVLSEFIDDLLHLERSKNGLNQHRTSDGTPRDAQRILGKVENIVPKTSFKMRFHLGEIEVWTITSLDQLVGIVKEVKAEVKKTATDGFPINDKMLLIQVPATRTSF
jgi:hypothetical protein